MIAASRRRGASPHLATVDTTGYQSFAERSERSAKRQTRSANVLPRAALSKEPQANKLPANESLPRDALGKVFAEHMEPTSRQTI